MANPPPDVTRAVLVVEEHAHWSGGHFPVRFAQLSEAYVEVGYRVEVLTAWGWSLADQVRDPPFAIHRFGWTARQWRRIAGWLRGRGTGTAVRRLGARAGDIVAHFALAGAVRARRRRMDPVPVSTVILGWDTDPVLLAALVGPGRWLSIQFRPPEPTQQDGMVARTMVRAAAGRAERHRRAAGGCFRIATPDATWRTSWAAEAPLLDPIVLSIAGARAVPRASDARHRLGLDQVGKLALLFGSEYAKLIDCALEAFACLDDWTLVVAGELAGRVDPSHARNRGLVLFPGFVDNDTRDLLLASADLMVLSFTPGYRSSSGTLMDALSAGVPVVCSTESAAAEIVDAYRLGTLFAPGVAASLADAVRRAPECIPPADLARAQTVYSNRAIARAQQHALGLTT